MTAELSDVQRDRARAQALLAEARMIQSQADAAGVDLTIEQDQKIAALVAEAEKLQPSGAGLSCPSAEQYKKLGIADPLGREADAPVAQPARGRKYADLFPAAAKAKSPWSSNEEFFQTVALGLGDARLKLMASMSGMQGSSGGFMIPAPLAGELLDRALEDEVVRPRAVVYAMTSETLKIASFDDSNNATGIYGFSTQWLPELGTATRSDGKIRAIELNCKKLVLYVAASTELIQDGRGFEAQLGQRMANAVSFGLDDAFLNGDGAGKPRGILNDPALVTVTKETGQLAATLVYENICNMWSRLLPSSTRNAVWCAHPSCIPQLFALTIGVGTAGQPFPVISQDGATMTIFGRPVIISEKLQQLGTKGDLLLCDFSYYAVGLRQEVAIERSNAPGWLTDSIDLRVRVRADGMGILASAHTPKRGTNTLSPFVALATRA